MDIDISNIQKGDHVAVVFNHAEPSVGTFTVSGMAHQPLTSEALWVGGRPFLEPSGTLYDEVAEVAEHRAKEPDVGFFGVADDGTLWARSKDHGWLLLNTYEGIIGKGYSWEQVVDILDGAGLMPVTA